ncbi:MarR family winged helix-turn-helix transcriptional regulator [Pseudosulfitobacter pseudonitzschiae]|nr:MarR family transcriptional regulator [Pseudosulfitobacter pseudonitzschiae]MCA0134403.1 MarR family transcriptional regulator [Pseudosulfitobacter pseudonitzschiae]MCD2325967.1 MarR family transcriptional regulator [Pseudosulfitobacter pseudonitzschiae]MCD2350413.1 MarR family transcriptional regulator [Pseudosulfitobacter pseudonitzschiae]MCI2215972.1 MarR family transcriptional regulator [Pseudosulfitobacter pseudonitzschiae]UFE28823.1 MarR family transcriptional regulator [Pseudosulfito
MMDASLPLSVTHEIRDRCLCLYVQRAARVLARRFDDALRPFGLTNGQFSLLMSLNRPDGPRISDLVDLLGMDRTTLTAALKPLERKGLVTAKADKDDRRARRLHLTDAGRSVLKQALPTWRATHDAVDAALAPTSPQDLRDGLMALAGA